MCMRDGRKNNWNPYKDIYADCSTTMPILWGDNSMSLRRIWTKLGFCVSPPGASYTAQGPQKQSELSDQQETTTC